MRISITAIVQLLDAGAQLAITAKAQAVLISLGSSPAQPVYCRIGASVRADAVEVCVPIIMTPYWAVAAVVIYATLRM